jgi:hypothetical protein
MQVVVPVQGTQLPPERPHWALVVGVMQVDPTQHPVPQLVGVQVSDRQLPLRQL